jgi:hypothetical protein
MDEDRRVRFLVAPLLLFASLIWAMWLDASWHYYLVQHLKKLPNEPVSALIAAILSGGIFVFSAGFVIGTITYVMLRGSFRLVSFLRRRGPRQHEIGLSENTLNVLYDKLLIPGDSRLRVNEIYLGVTFDHGILQTRQNGVHRWIVRRWNAFSINCTSITALLLSIIFVWFAGIQFSAWWYVPVLVAVFMFCWTAFWAWRDTMGMLDFQAILPWQDLSHGKSNHIK